MLAIYLINFKTKSFQKKLKNFKNIKQNKLKFLKNMFNFTNSPVLCFLQCFCKLLKTHFQTLLIALDAVKDVKVLKNNKRRLTKDQIIKLANSKTKKPFQIHSHYILPEISALYIFLDSLYIYYCNDFHYSNTSMPTLFSHLIFPNELWKVADISLFFIFLDTLITYLNLIFDQPVDGKYIMHLFVDHQNKENKHTIVQNSNALCRFETEKIVAFRRKIKQVLPWNMAALMLLIDSFCLYNLCSHWTDSFRFYFILTVFHPVVFYSVNCKYYFC